MTSTTILSRPRAKHVLLAALALVIAGCTETGNGGVLIPQEAIEQFGDSSADEIFTYVGPKTFISAFDRYCARNINNPAKTIALLRSDGYISLARARNEVTIYAHKDGKPVIGLGRRTGSPDMCMIMSRKNSALKPAVNAYIHRISNGKLFDISGISNDTEQTWASREPKPVLYLTFNDNDPDLGPLYAFAVAKAN